MKKLMRSFFYSPLDGGMLSMINCMQVLPMANLNESFKCYAFYWQIDGNKFKVLVFTVLQNLNILDFSI